MEDKFNYAQAIAELEKIAAKVEDPATGLEDIDKYIARSEQLLKACRDYLRGTKEKLEKLNQPTT